MYKVVLRNRPLTRRGILSEVSQIYDPIGFLAPVVLRGRQIMQECCILRLNWDDDLPDELASRWIKWRDDLYQLETLSVTRCFKPENFGEVSVVQLHTFSDASTTGYGVCSFLRLVNGHGQVHCVLVSAKARVTPLKQISIPRLELTAAVLSTKISAFLKRELSYDDIEEFFWTDSQVVLAYIANLAKRFHVFVANQIQKIKDYWTIDHWSHVKSENNPADIASRGLKADQLINCTLWFKGPDFLWSDQLPESSLFPEIEETNPELKKTRTFATSTKTCDSTFWAYFSSFPRLVKAIANCKKYMLKLRYLVKKRQDATAEKPCMDLNVEDLKDAENCLLRLVQRDAYAEELRELSSPTSEQPLKKSSPLYKLNPFIDDKGLIRMGGRIDQIAVYEQKHPTT